jgi:diguanylate cyclase (GGDEF)-like protein
MNIGDELNLELIKDNIDILKKLYDVIRIVDPVTKKVLLYDEGKLIEKGSSCFSKIEKEQMCKNCISLRALKDNKTYMKLENSDDKSYLITVMPMELEDKIIIVELIKEVTDTLFYGHSLDTKGCKVNNIIQEMKQLTIKDSLTEIANRRFIDERLPVDMKICYKSKQPISIIMVDVDHFKNINDQFGHVAGDEVLREFAYGLKSCIRDKRDWIGRYGGEEFLICVPGAASEAALVIAERMKKHLEEKNFVLNGENIKITASFGICTIQDKNITMEEFLKCVDQKLYDAKNAGRNRIIH